MDQAGLTMRPARAAGTATNGLVGSRMISRPRYVASSTAAAR